MKLPLQEREDAIHNLFPYLSTEDFFENKHNYRACSVSVFDHCLSESEADVAFDETETNGYKKKFINFYTDLFRSFEVFMFLESKWGGSPILSFSSLAEFIEWVGIVLEERYFTRILIPELGMILNGGYDYTHTLFLAEGADLETIEKIVNEHGLFILD